MSNPWSGIPISRTKLYPALPPPDLVVRSRLESRLNEHVKVPLTLVSAPAGYGKSTLLGHWIKKSGEKTTWLSLDEADNDLRQFITYLVEAISATTNDACPNLMRMLDSDHIPPVEQIAVLLANDLDALTVSTILILDDYHQINNSEIHTLIGKLLKNHLRNFRLFILSRRDPPLELASLRANHQMVDIRMKDLQFTPDETRLFIEKATQSKLKPQTLETLQLTTEGWPVGLRLATLMIHSAEDAEAILKRYGSHSKPIKQYLVEEVLSSLPKWIRQRIRYITILDRFNAALCEAIWSDDFAGEGLSEQGMGQRFISAIRKHGLFCISLDEQGDWYRLHHLFNDLLEQQLREKLAPDLILKLHRRASAWFLQQNLFEDAIKHGLAGKSEADAVQAVHDARHQLMNRDRWYRLGKWLDMFPNETVENNLDLLMARCWLDLNHLHRADLLVKDLGLAENLLQSTKTATTEKTMLTAELASLRSGIAYWTLDANGCITLAELARKDSPPEQECVKSTALLMQSAAHQLQGAAAEGKQLLLNHLDTRVLGLPCSRARLLQGLCFIYWISAETRNLLQVATELLRESEQNTQSWSLSFAHYFLGLAHYERNETLKAIEYLQPVLDEPYRNPMQNVAHCAFILSLAHLALGESDKSREVAEQIERLTIEYGNKEFIELSEAFLAELDLRQGNQASASQWAATHSEFPPHAYTRPVNEELTYIKVKLAEGNNKARRWATERLDKLILLLEKTHHRRLLIEAFGLKALVELEQGHEKRAVYLLEQAIALGQPGELVRPLADLGGELGKLLNLLKLDTTADRYIGKVYSALKGATDKSAVSIEHQPLHEPLTQREIEILELISRNLTNKEIANQLNLSTGTVKRHAHNIFGKLAVYNRKDAVSKARLLSLLPD